MRHYRPMALTAGVGLARVLLLPAAKTDDMNVITGFKAFTNTAALSPGLARKITAQDLPQPQPPGWLKGSWMFVRAGASSVGKGPGRPDNAIPKAPAGFKVDIYVGSGLR